MPDDKDRINILLEEYMVQTNWERHNENQRSQLASVLLAISAALITLFPKDRPLTPNDWSIPVLLIVIGIFGILAVLKYWERFSLHGNIGHHFREVLDTYFEDNLFINTYNNAVQEHDKNGEQPLFKDKYLKQHWLWEGVFVVIILLGIFFLVRVFCQV
jgi:hypothetical protein